MEKEKSCGALIFRTVDDKLYTLVVRSHDGTWEFPKGGSNPFESERQTALRAVKENTGIVVSFIDGFRRTVNYSPKPGVLKEVVYYIAYPTGGEETANPDRITDMQWCSMFDTMALLSYPDTDAVYRTALRFLKDRTGDPL